MHIMNYLYYVKKDGASQGKRTFHDYHYCTIGLISHILIYLLTFFKIFYNHLDGMQDSMTRV